MLYRQLGRSTLSVSSIGVGGMSFADEAEATRVVHRAVESGINFFDTADLYDKGMNEEMLGRMLKGRREQVVLATKVGNQWRADGSGWDWNPGAEYIIKAVESSLRRLGTDRIDLYQLHGGTLEDPIDETIGAFELLQQQGKIRYYGLSSIRPNVIREYIRRSRIVSVMMQYSLLDRRPEESCLGLLEEAGIGVLARGVLGKGLLAGKEAISYLDRSKDEVERAANAVKVVADGRQTKADIAVRYVLSHPGVTSAIVGVRTVGQLEAVLSVNGEEGLGAEGLKKLRESLPPNHYERFR